MPAAHSFFESEYYAWDEKFLPFFLNFFSIVFGTVFCLNTVRGSFGHSRVLLSFATVNYQPQGKLHQLLFYRRIGY